MATKRQLLQSTLEVRQDMLPIYSYHADIWERIEGECTVWTYDGFNVKVHARPIPDDYAPGLLKCYIDDRHVMLPEFVEALKPLGLTLDDVKRQIEEARR